MPNGLSGRQNSQIRDYTCCPRNKVSPCALQQQQVPQQQQQPQQPQHQQQQPSAQQQLGFATIQQQQLQQPAYEPARPEQLDGGTEQLPGDASATLYVDGMPLDVTKREMAHIFRPFEGFNVSPFFTANSCAQGINLAKRSSVSDTGPP